MEPEKIRSSRRGLFLLTDFSPSYGSHFPVSVNVYSNLYWMMDIINIILIITKYVYELLEKDCNLKKISIPVDATESEPKSFIFMSEDALTNPQKLMVLIHGSGVVRAGQWARRLIINEDLDSGTQIPFIKRAMDVSAISFIFLAFYSCFIMCYKLFYQKCIIINLIKKQIWQKKKSYFIIF
uniref:ARB2 cotranscriptional regulator A n=1 Tax=Sus scrofa TaxID=9823 RepID=A0A8D0WLE0_PIG